MTKFVTFQSCFGEVGRSQSQRAWCSSVVCLFTLRRICQDSVSVMSNVARHAEASDDAEALQQEESAPICIGSMHFHRRYPARDVSVLLTSHGTKVLHRPAVSGERKP